MPRCRRSRSSAATGWSILPDSAKRPGLVAAHRTSLPKAAPLQSCTKRTPRSTVRGSGRPPLGANPLCLRFVMRFGRKLFFAWVGLTLVLWGGAFWTIRHLVETAFDHRARESFEGISQGLHYVYTERADSMRQACRLV